MTIKFTRGHLVGIAQVLAGEVAKSAPMEMNRLRSTGEALANLFAASNPRFNRARFITAAGLDDTGPATAPVVDIRAGRTKGELLQQIADMEHDWNTLNGFLTATALTRGWCGEYEERVGIYNRSFKRMALSGRESSRDFGDRRDEGGDGQIAGFSPGCVLWGSR